MRAAILGAVVGCSLFASASAEVSFTFTISDSGGTHSAYYEDIQAAITAAGEQWTQYLPQSGNLEIQVFFVDGLNTVNGREAQITPVGTEGGFNIFQPGPAVELNGGGDPTPGGADVRFDIGTGILSQMWFDPNPELRGDVVPEGSFDAISLFMPGFGRALGFFSYLGPDGTVPPGSTAKSTFDLHVSPSGGTPYFTGPEAVAVYGGPVPLTQGIVRLLGNTGGPGMDLSGDVMNGIHGIQPGTRYFVSELDLAILRDSGLDTLPIPEPRAALLLGGALFVLLVAARRRKA